MGQFFGANLVECCFCKLFKVFVVMRSAVAVMQSTASKTNNIFMQLISAAQCHNLYNFLEDLA